MFLRIMTSDFGGWGKRGATGTVMGFVVLEFPHGVPCPEWSPGRSREDGAGGNIYQAIVQAMEKVE